MSAYLARLVARLSESQGSQEREVLAPPVRFEPVDPGPVIDPFEPDREDVSPMPFTSEAAAAGESGASPATPAMWPGIPAFPGPGHGIPARPDDARHEGTARAPAEQPVTPNLERAAIPGTPDVIVPPRTDSELHPADAPRSDEPPSRLQIRSQEPAPIVPARDGRERPEPGTILSPRPERETPVERRNDHGSRLPAAPTDGRQADAAAGATPAHAERDHEPMVPGRGAELRPAAVPEPAPPAVPARQPMLTIGRLTVEVVAVTPPVTTPPARVARGPKPRAAPRTGAPGSRYRFGLGQM